MNDTSTIGLRSEFHGTQQFEDCADFNILSGFKEKKKQKQSASIELAQEKRFPLLSKIDKTTLMGKI
jgi:hypothetical protein